MDAKVVRLGTGILSGSLLVTMGAQIAAAPVTLPLLLWGVASSPSAVVRVCFTMLAALTAAFVGWFAAYSTVGEVQPWIIGIPAASAVLAIVISALVWGHRPLEEARADGRG